MDNNNLKDFFKKNGFSIAICSSIAILLIATLYFSYNNFNPSNDDIIAKEENNSNFEAVNKSDVKSYKEVSTESSSQSSQNSQSTTEKPVDNKKSEVSSETTTEIKNENKTSEDKKPKDENKSQVTTEDKVFSMFDDSKEMTWPVFGKIVMDYSTETAIYDKTLEQYRTNNSICISSPEGTDVMASSEGVVERIDSSLESGKSIVINHGNGWLSTYSQLQDDILVAVGQIVKEGEYIGKIGSPQNFNVLLGPHLEFRVLKDEITEDPKLVLAQIEE